MIQNETSNNHTRKTGETMKRMKTGNTGWREWQSERDQMRSGKRRATRLKEKILKSERTLLARDVLR